MSNVDDIRRKQREKLEKLSPEERARALLRRGMQEIRARGDSIPEPDILASGKSDENGNMVDDEPSPDEDNEIDR
jgi:hypothetical protein